MFTFGGGGDDGSWGTYVLLGLVAAPFVVGLILRLLDRRAGSRVQTWRGFWVRSAVAAACVGAALTALATGLEAPATVALLSALVIAPTAWPPPESGTPRTDV